jgi:hypothetical protein
MNKKSQTEIVQWSYDFIHNFYLNNTESLTGQERMYLDYLSPFSGKYFSALNPVLLYGGADIKQLLKKKEWLVRDGLIPLSFFFKEKLLNKEGLNLTIHKDLFFIVPPEWRNNVTFYEIEADNKYDKIKLPKQIILFGMPNETLADPDEFEEDVSMLANTFGKKNIQNMKIIAYLPNKRTDLWGRWQDENFFKYGKSIFKNLKMDIEFPELQTIESMSDLKDSLYFEINRGHIIKDTFTQHFFLSKGAGMLKPEKNSFEKAFIKKDRIRLSLHHSVQTYKLKNSDFDKYDDPFSNELMPYYKKLLEKSMFPKHINQEWEKWFGTYIRIHYKSSGLI